MGVDIGVWPTDLDDERHRIGYMNPENTIQMSARNDARTIEKTVRTFMDNLCGSSTDGLNDERRPIGSMSPAVRMAECEDAQTIEETVRTFMDNLCGSPTDGLNDELRRIGSMSPVVRMAECEDAQTIEETGQSLIDDLYRVLPQILTSEETRRTFMDNLYRVLPQILASLHQSSEKSKREIHLLESAIKKSSLAAADLQRGLGWNGLKSAGLVVALSVAALLLPNETDRATANLLAREVAPKAMEVFRCGDEGELTLTNNRVTLLNNKYNLQATQEQTKGNQQQQIKDILDKLHQLLTAATRVG